jgi:hypothetical protein
MALNDLFFNDFSDELVIVGNKAIVKETDPPLAVKVRMCMLIRYSSEAAILSCLIVPFNLCESAVKHAHVAPICRLFGEVVQQLGETVILGKHDCSLTVAIVHLPQLLLLYLIVLGV